MFNLFNAFNKKNKLWDFNGGIHPPEMKSQTSGIPLRRLSLPPYFIIPLQQHLGPEGELLVSIGDRVLKGQPLTQGSGRCVPVHAPTSGTIQAIAPFTTAHPSGLNELCVQLMPDNQEEWYPLQSLKDYTHCSPEELINKIHQSGIAGLGGAGFPTASKIRGGMEKISTLIINAAECEPYITADDRLMQEHAADIIEGCRILQHILSPEEILIGIEDNKPEAITALKKVLPSDRHYTLKVIPTKYPSGGAKQLTKILTGKEVPHGKHSATIGVLMQNVGTVYAIKKAVLDGEPLIERVVTLTGNALQQPGNVWGLLGTPVKHLLNAGQYQSQTGDSVIMGGPLMGFTLPHLDVPIIKISNCILAPSLDEIAPAKPEQACIRCGECAFACPAGLLPQQLYWFSKGEEHEKARNYNLFDCIECGACAYVCPSNIPLVQYYRQEKAEIRAMDQENQRATQAKERFEAKQHRLEQEKLARQQKHQQAAERTLNAAEKQDVQAAIERVRARQQKSPATEPSATNRVAASSAIVFAKNIRKDKIVFALAEPQKISVSIDSQSLSSSAENGNTDNRDKAVAAAIARAKAEKAAMQQKTLSEEPAAETETHEDPHKAAVAAAIARAKAKKAAAQQEKPSEEPAAETDIHNDPRKAAVAAAIARAKAKKAAAQQEKPSEEPAAETKTHEDPRKAAVAAAIARAKAKKAAAQQEKPSEEPAAETDTHNDPRKAAVAAAIARAKAKKAAMQPETESDEPVTESNDDKRKVIVAAAIARAKAKKANRDITEGHEK